MLSTISRCISFVETQRAPSHVVVVIRGAEPEFQAHGGHDVKSG